MRENIVLNTKMIIYIALFIAVGVLFIQELEATSSETPDRFDQYMEVSDPDSESSDFWPADMVPHPVLPGDGPKDPNGGDLA